MRYTGGPHTYLLYVFGHACPLVLDEEATTITTTTTVEHARPHMDPACKTAIINRLLVELAAFKHDVGILCLHS